MKGTMIFLLMTVLTFTANAKSFEAEGTGPKGDSYCSAQVHDYGRGPEIRVFTSNILAERNLFDSTGQLVKKGKAENIHTGEDSVTLSLNVKNNQIVGYTAKRHNGLDLINLLSLSVWTTEKCVLETPIPYLEIFNEI